MKTFIRTDADGIHTLLARAAEDGLMREHPDRTPRAAAIVGSLALAGVIGVLGLGAHMVPSTEQQAAPAGSRTSGAVHGDQAVTAPTSLAEVEAIIGYPVRAATAQASGTMTERRALRSFGQHPGADSATTAAYSLGFAEIGYPTSEGSDELTWRHGWVVVSDVYRGDYYDSSTASETSASPAATPTRTTRMRDIAFVGADGDFEIETPFRATN